MIPSYGVAHQLRLTVRPTCNTLLGTGPASVFVHFDHLAIQGELRSLRCRTSSLANTVLACQISSASRGLNSVDKIGLVSKNVASATTWRSPHRELSPLSDWRPIRESRPITIIRPDIWPGSGRLALFVGALDVWKGKVTHRY